MGIYSFAEMQSENGDAFSHLDYVHYAFNTLPVGPDLAKSLMKLLVPELYVAEGIVLVSDAQKKFVEHKSRGFSTDEAQYWANLLELDGLLGNLTFEENVQFAQVVKLSWQNSLDVILPKCSQSVRIIADEEEGEVFLTVCGSAYNPMKEV